MGWDADKEMKYLEELVKKEKDIEVKDRLRAILLLKKNFKQYEVAEILGITERTVYNWKIRYKQHEYEGLKTRLKQNISMYIQLKIGLGMIKWEPQKIISNMLNNTMENFL